MESLKLTTGMAPKMRGKRLEKSWTLLLKEVVARLVRFQ
jgi:hypothetical protein